MLTTPPSRRLLHWIALLAALAPAFALLWWGGSGTQTATALYNWPTPDAWLLPTPGLPYLLAGIAAMAAITSFLIYLLATTPPNAIKLPWWASAIIIIALSAGMRLILVRTWTPTLAPHLPASTAHTLLPYTLAADFLTLALLLITLHLTNRSLWSAALVAFHPLALIEATHPSYDALLLPALLAATLALAHTPAYLAHRKTKLLPLSHIETDPTPSSTPATRSAKTWTLIHQLLAAHFTLAAATFVFLSPFSAPWPAQPDHATGLLATLLHRLFYAYEPFSLPLFLGTLFTLSQLALLALAHRRRWPLPHTLLHALTLALLLHPAPQPVLALYPLILLPLTYTPAAYTLTLSFLPFYLTPTLTPTLPPWLLLLTTLPPTVLQLQSLLTPTPTPTNNPTQIPTPPVRAHKPKPRELTI